MFEIIVHQKDFLYRIGEQAMTEKIVERTGFLVLETPEAGEDRPELGVQEKGVEYFAEPPVHLEIYPTVFPHENSSGPVPRFRLRQAARLLGQGRPGQGRAVDERPPILDQSGAPALDPRKQVVSRISPVSRILEKFHQAPLCRHP